MTWRSLTTGLACLGIMSCRAQSLTWSVVPEVAGSQLLAPEIVLRSMSDHGPFFGGWQGALSVSVDHEFPSKWAVGGEVGYALGQASFETSCGCAVLGDRVAVLAHDLRTQSIEAIGALRLRSNNERFWYARGGLGVGMITRSARVVEYDIRFVGGHQPDTSIALLDEEFRLRTSAGALVVPVLDLGFGHRLSTPHPLDVEIFLHGDLDSWSYTVTNLQGVTQEVALRRTLLGLRFRLVVGGRKTRQEPAP